MAGFVCQDCGTKTIVSLGSCQHDESFPKPPPHVSDGELTRPYVHIFLCTHYLKILNCISSTSGSVCVRGKCACVLRLERN